MTEQQEAPAQPVVTGTAAEIPGRTPLQRGARAFLFGDYPITRQSKRQPCPRFRGSEHLYATKDEGRVGISHPRCYKLTCDACWPIVVWRRAQDLRKVISEEVDEVWYGQVPSSARSAIRSFKAAREGIYLCSTTYHGTSEQTIIATANVSPNQPFLTKMSVSKAMWLWLAYGLEYRVKRTDSDWKYKRPSEIDHIYLGAEDVMAYVTDKMEMHPGQIIEDAGVSQSTAYRLAAVFSEGEEDYP